MVTGNKAETARRCGVSIGTVRNVLQQAYDGNQGLVEARAEAAGQIASKFHIKAEEMLDSISPQDIESGRIPLRDKHGTITGYKYYGPSLLQKATAIGIITDKASVAQTYERALRQDTHDGRLLLPEDIEGLRHAIEGKVKSLRILDVQFENNNPELVQKTQDLVGEVARIENEEATQSDVVSFDEFDNPK